MLLKPCPFDCGSIEHKCFPELIEEDLCWYVTCGWCGAVGASWKEKETAIEEWNKRRGKDD